MASNKGRQRKVQRAKQSEQVKTAGNAGAKQTPQGTVRGKHWLHGAFLCKLEVSIPVFQSKIFPVDLIRETWTLTANRCLNGKSVNFRSTTAADLTVEGTLRKDRRSRLLTHTVKD